MFLRDLPRGTTISPTFFSETFLKDSSLELQNSNSTEQKVWCLLEQGFYYELCKRELDPDKRMGAAERSFRKALSLAETTGDLVLIGTACQYLASTLLDYSIMLNVRQSTTFNQRNREKLKRRIESSDNEAIVNFERALKAFGSIDDLEGEMSICCNLAGNYIRYRLAVLALSDQYDLQLTLSLGLMEAEKSILQQLRVGMEKLKLDQPPRPILNRVGRQVEALVKLSEFGEAYDRLHLI
ncbi:MAG: hypothetical protein AAB774_00285 [Patescibacteria group bacterium]